MLSLDRVGAAALADWKHRSTSATTFVAGEVITSRRGELSVLADEWRMTAKALRPLPVAHKPISEEARVRQRYVDLIIRPEAREWSARERRPLPARLVPPARLPRGRDADAAAAAGRGRARPFVTHPTRSTSTCYLRIAPELFLKRCLVGGIEKVFEINRNFRNEGIGSAHIAGVHDARGLRGLRGLQLDGTLTRELVQEAGSRCLAPPWWVTRRERNWNLAGNGPCSRSTARCRGRSARRREVRARAFGDRLRDMQRARGAGRSRRVVGRQLAEELSRSWSCTKLIDPWLVRNIRGDVPAGPRGPHRRAWPSNGICT